MQDVIDMCDQAGGFFAGVGGQYGQALGLYKVALDCALALHGSQHLDVAKTHNNMGIVYEAQGKYEEALEAHSKSLDIKIELVGDMHRDVAATHTNMGNVYRSLSRYEDALFHHGKALEVFVATLGHGHPDIADTKYNMAILHQKRGERKEAKQLWLECQAIYAKVFGADHSKTAGAAQQARDCA